MSKFIISGLMGLFLVIASSAYAESPKAKFTVPAWAGLCGGMIGKAKVDAEKSGDVISNNNDDDIMNTSYDVIIGTEKSHYECSVIKEEPANYHVEFKATLTHRPKVTNIFGWIVC